MALVLPVIHHLDQNLTLAEADLAMRCGADGLFLISHHGDDDVLPALAATLKGRFPGKLIGINLLGRSLMDAYQNAQDFSLDAVWADRAGVSSAGLSEEGQWLATRIRESGAMGPQVFASVAFKYQEVDVNPPAAAALARQIGAIPTTSGKGTGSAPTVAKIASMSEASEGVLAVASGMDCDNVGMFASHLSHILVATGVSRDDYRIDEAKLRAFVECVRTIARA